MFGKEAICPDGLFVLAILQEWGFYFNNLNCPRGKSGVISLGSRDISLGPMKET